MTTLSPFKRRGRIGSDLWDVFSDFYNESFFAPFKSDTHHFRTDIKDTGDKYLIEAELPGVEKEDITIKYQNNYLTITAKRESAMKEEKDNFIRQEISYGNFARRFYVADINEDAIDATFKNGILTLNCPKVMITNTDKKLIEIH
ncbi:heat-shock protein [Bacillus sp. AFS076308]|uniref:Hsp20/alpha crystallin family protein n=1 Tax=unclassified Bacillus (in: firmicutes) TaxID=185979 RepID=UPI000BF3CFA1|nr:MULTISPECIES: Hsp20/alpha crystallin family protein [unclassified Bacillus (in: firmicutes)]PFO09350.1 heat-shock protein [Bacillus sp. AFS076308]PGV50328.1 heat-shock protein [Bacillus sp. AFS037270]